MRRRDNLCRLCSFPDCTVDLFSLKCPNGEQLRQSILIATGIEIKETDIVSTSVCQRCCEIAEKLHKYRQNAISNDKLLKEQYDQAYIPPATDCKDIHRTESNTGENHQEITNTNGENANDHTSLRATLCVNDYVDLTDNNLNSDTVIDSVAQDSTTKQKRVHPSVRKLQEQFKGIILPDKVLESHVLPVVTLDKNEVTDWFEEKANAIRKRLSGVVIKKLTINSPNNTNVPNISTYNSIRVPSDALSLTLTASAQKKLRCTTNTPDADNTKNEYKSFETATNQQIERNDVIPKDISCLSHGRPQQAEKRTAQQSCSGHKRDGNNVDNHTVIPKKRTRLFYHQGVTHALNKMDLPTNLPVNEEQRKAILVSSLELTPVNIQRTEDVTCNLLVEPNQPEFVCNFCNKSFNLNRQLIKHQKIHFRCKFCRKRFKNMTSLHTHEQQSCFTIIVKNQPVIRLKRVDSIQSIVSKYLKPMETKTAEHLACTSNKESIDSGNHNLTFSKQLKTEPIKILDDNNRIDKEDTTDVVYISDTDDEHVCVEKPKPKIIQMPSEITTGSCQSSMEPGVSLKYLMQNDLSERELIRLLLKKHNYSPKKGDNSTQTSFISNRNVKYTNTNCIILENALPELLHHKIPVFLRKQEKITAIFKNTSPQPITPTLERWTDKTCIDIKEPSPINKRMPRYTYQGPPTTLAKQNTSCVSGTQLVKKASNTTLSGSVSNSLATNSSLPPSADRTVSNILSNSNSSVSTKNVLMSILKKNNNEFPNSSAPNSTNNSRTQWNGHRQSHHLPRPVIQSNNKSCVNALVLVENQTGNRIKEVSQRVSNNPPPMCL